ncbi:MAG: NfeD family protein [Alcanivorax sediminis]|uniref:NfeD family protein n=1 Tax=Alcanivorax sediminis TaxID=2663008 RepID=A0A6N7LSU2_9GAMM|nr:NfeD family protein [Alcanivorax sediminis]MQX52095.1 NfeD family protein [Alcanivorax sediminis]
MPEYSYWIIAGLALVIAEFVVSGLVVIFFGVAALIVGSLKYLGLLDDTVWELTLFAVLSILSLVFVRRFLSDKLMGKENVSAGEEDSAGLIGQRATVVAPFTNGTGSVTYRGARWQAQSDQTLEAGQIVRITQHDGLWLTVEPWTNSSS